MARIRRFGVLQTAKFAAVMYFIIGAIMVLPMALFMAVGMSSPHGRGQGGMFILLLFMPVIQAVVGFVGIAIACLIYNAVARLAGGIEIELE